MASLTDAYLRALTPPAAGRVEIRDDLERGLVLRLTPDGTATWSARALAPSGKHARVMLGSYPAMGLRDARKAAKKMVAAIQAGADPVAAKRAERAARKEAMAEATVADRLAAWQAARAADPRKPWSAAYAREVARIAEREIGPALGRRKLRETTREQWTRVIAQKAQRTPAMAALLYRVTSSFLNHAEAAGWIDMPLLPRKGARTLAPPPLARERVLSDAELAAVWRAADREAPKLRAFVRLLILTAAREGEVAGIAAGEIDLEASAWAVPGGRTKNGRGYAVPLGPLALAELRAVWPVEEAPDPGFCLLGRSGGPFSGFTRLKERMDRASGVSAWRWHDLRRTARTGMARLGVPSVHAELAVNHVSGRSALERTYDRHDYSAEIAAALLRWQGHVAAVIGEAGAVVPLRAKAVRP